MIISRGILVNHAPMMSALDTGVLRFKEDGTWKPLVVMGGFATVDSNQLSVPFRYLISS